MGPTGTPTEIPRTRRCCWPAAGSATPCCSRSPGRSRRRAAGCSTSPATGTAPICSSARRSRRRPTRWCGPPTPASAIEPHRPQDRHFRGNIVQAMVAYAEGRARRAGGAAATTVGRDHRHRLRSHDGRGEGGAARRARAAPAARPRRHRQHQLADAVHDEGSLRAVPAAPRRSGDRPRGVHLLLLQPGPGARPRRLRQPARRGCKQNSVQEKIANLWLGHVLAQAPPRWRTSTLR